MASMSMRQMLEAGVHFGHQTRFWNPKMAPFIFGERNQIHIINLEKTLPLFVEAAGFVKHIVADGGTRAVRRHQALGARGRSQQRGDPLRHALREPPLARRHAHQLQDHPPVDQAARRDLTTWPRTARSSSAARRKRMMLRRERDKLERSLGGIKDMDGLPDVLFVDRRRPREHRDPRGQQARHPGRRDRRHQLLAGRHRLRDPGQRRRDARHPAVRRRHRRRGARGPLHGPGRRRSAKTSSSSSTRKASRAPKAPARSAAPPRRRKKTPGAPQAGGAESDVAADAVAELAEADPEESPEAFMARREAARKEAPAPAAAPQAAAGRAAAPSAAAPAEGD